MGYFDKCKGIILGSFTELEQHGELPVVQEYIEEMTAGNEIPIVKTNELGHGKNGKCIVIGSRIELA
ncbi:hypothetical protein [Paenibacillus caui]|uniref:hypothetical protein n=1 Tax=Paenibacillus caui TaxID=2873927 RepID=UPI003B5883BE